MNMIGNAVDRVDVVALFDCFVLNMFEDLATNLFVKGGLQFFCSPYQMNPEFIECLGHGVLHVWKAVNGLTLFRLRCVPDPKGSGYSRCSVFKLVSHPESYFLLHWSAITASSITIPTTTC
jgi:hypothetical protein